MPSTPTNVAAGFEHGSWLVRRMLMGLTAKNYNQQIPVIIGRVATDSERADEVILEELRTGIGQISRWPTDSELRQQVRDRSMYGYISQARVTMVLGATEESLYTGKVEMLLVPNGLSIEHVLPQRWEEHWPLVTDGHSEEVEAAEAARRAHVHLLGNLTLTTLPLNAALSVQQRGRSSRRSLIGGASCYSTHD